MLYNQDWNKSQQNPVADLLLRGAYLIEKYGHTKGELKNENGAMCFMGALVEGEPRSESLQWPKVIEDAAEITVKAINLELDNDYITTIVDWNNAPERTGEEVIAAMRLAAQLVQQGESNGNVQKEETTRLL